MNSAETPPARRPTINLPEMALVALIGASSAGKSSFAARHFLPSEVLSSDVFRRLVSDDEGALDANADTFDSLFYVAAKRLRRGLLTVIDATSVRAEDRKKLVALAREYDVLPVAIVLDLPLSVLRARHDARAERDFDPDVLRRQQHELRRGIGGLHREGFRYIWTLREEAEVDGVQLQRVPLLPNRTELRGPFDVIGDVHGCLGELNELLMRLDYPLTGLHPQGRTAVFVGDLADRGPDSAGVLLRVMDLVRSGSALCVPGNHDDKLLRWLEGKKVTLTHGLEGTVKQLEAAGEAVRAEVRSFLSGLVSHLVLDGGALVVAHAGLPEHYQGRASGRVRSFALYGDVDGSTDEAGFPVRGDWAQSYRGKRRVIYGHTPVARAQWVNNTIDIDTGCVFGGALSALRYPELEVLSVPARQQYAAPGKPLSPAASDPNILDLADFSGPQRLDVRTFGTVALREAELLGALETFGRFGAAPTGVLYLPPTMSPVETSALPGLLEHPREAFAYYREQGLDAVICQEKHMGSRGLLLLTRRDEVARQHFGLEHGLIYTRTGRRFFRDQDWERDILHRCRAAAEEAGLWTELDTDWLLLDTEILPWSLKAGELLRGQYAATGAAGLAAVTGAVAQLEEAVQGGADLAGLLAHTRQRQADLRAYRDVYRAYVRRVEGPQDVRIAPFHLLASEGAVHDLRPHTWHLEILGRLVEAAPELFIRTVIRTVDLHDPISQAEATAWWEASTTPRETNIGEGMVVKPLNFRDPERRALQPALKVRGAEYLRLIYGPEYSQPQHLERLRERAVKAKRSRAIREFHLGLEGLHRFVGGDGLRKVHACVLGVLALEQGELDARL
jgi:protein phosphatase